MPPLHSLSGQALYSLGGAVPPPGPQAPGGGSLEEEEERLEAPGGHADPCVPCLYPPGCSKMWDNITCWPATPRGQVVVLACPFIYNSPLQGKSPGLQRRCWVAQKTPTRVGM